MINIGLMRHKLIIQRLTAAADENYEQVENWEDICTVHCYAERSQGNEKDGARQEITQWDMAFTVRYSKSLAKMNEQDYRAVFKGENYDITFIDDPRYRHEVLRIYAKNKKARQLDDTV